MKTFLARFAIFLAVFASAFAQPVIPVSNLSPVGANSIVGNIGASGRAESIPLGSGLEFVGGALVSTGGGSGGTVTTIPDGSTNGVTWTVATRTTTPTFTFSLGAITPSTIVSTSSITSGTTFRATAAASPTTSIAGQFGFDSNAWAVSRGALQLFDGTANTYVVAALAADTPSNGQVPTWNTDGTVTWETPAAGATSVTAASTFGTTNRLIKSDGTGRGVQVTGITIADTTNDMSGVGNLTVANLTTTDLTISGTITGVMGAANGGTGQSSYTKGDIIAAQAATTLNKLAVGTNGYVLTANSSATNGVDWAPVSAGTVTVSGTPTSGQMAEWTSATNLQGLAVAGTGSAVRATSPAFTTNLTLPNGASPTTGAVAATAFDTDAWAASRGAVQVHDGTANTFLIGALASDTPSNGQVPVWNTGGTITWESAGGGSGTVSSGGAQRMAYYPSAGTTVDDATGSAQVIIGTANSSPPAAVFGIYGTTQAETSIGVRVSNATAGVGGELLLSHSRGTVASPGVTDSGDTLGRLMYGGWAASWNDYASGLKSLATSQWSSGSNTGANLVFMATVNASTTRTDALTLTATATDHTTLTSVGALSLVAGGTAQNINLTTATTGLILYNCPSFAPAFRFQRNAVSKMIMSVAETTNSIVTGSVADDFVFRNEASKGFLFSTDNSTIAMSIVASTGQVLAAKSIASTTKDTGAIVVEAGGLGVEGAIFNGGNITTSGDFVTDTIGKTLKVKSGSNAKAGTVTLASGAGTVSSTAITANSVIYFGLKTASGAITAQPYCTAVTVGTSYTVAAGGGDNSTYNWIILEVN